MEVRNQKPNTKITSKPISESQKEELNKTKEVRQRNFAIRDLIKILILRELLGNRQRPPIRPYPETNRSPFLNRPRPPMEPRIYEDIYYY